MKTQSKITRIAIAVMSLTIVTMFNSCSKEEGQDFGMDASVQTAARNSKAMLYSPATMIGGKSLAQWTKELWQWSLSYDCAHFPILDQTGALQDQGQSGPVFFLTGRRGGTIAVTVPLGKSILLPIIGLSDIYPNTTDGRTPLPGQTPEVFLDSLARLYSTEIGECSITIDGTEVTGLQNVYMVPSTQPYYFTANQDLANCYYSGLTGTSQLFCQSGVYVMLKPLAPGVHTIVRKAQFRGIQLQYNYQITLQ